MDSTPHPLVGMFPSHPSLLLTQQPPSGTSKNVSITCTLILSYFNTYRLLADASSPYERVVLGMLAEGEDHSVLRCPLSFSLLPSLPFPLHTHCSRSHSRRPLHYACWCCSTTVGCSIQVWYFKVKLESFAQY